MQIRIVLPVLALLPIITIKFASAVVGQKCQYPAHSHIRLPGSTKRHYLECESSQVYEEKECPIGTEFDSVSMICIYKLKETSQVPIWNSAEEDEDDLLIFNNKVSTKPPPQMQQPLNPVISRQHTPQLVPQWPNSMPIELYSSCTTDAWCPHDPTKLQYCDVNGEQFMQCSGSGWILKDCPSGAIFTGPLGRCVDPRENLQPLTNNPTMPPLSQITPQLFSGGIPNSKVISFGSNIVGSLPSPLLSQEPNKQPSMTKMGFDNNQLPNVNQHNPQTRQPTVNGNNNNLEKSISVAHFINNNMGQSQQPFATFGSGSGLSSNFGNGGSGNGQQQTGLENVHSAANQHSGFGSGSQQTGSQNNQNSNGLAVQPIPNVNNHQGFGNNHQASVFSFNQQASPTPAIQQIHPHIIQSVHHPESQPTQSPITTSGHIPAWAQSTHVPSVTSGHDGSSGGSGASGNGLNNFIIGGQQTLSLTPDQIAQLPRGQLIFIPANSNDSISSIQNAIQVSSVTSQLKASSSQQHSWPAKNLGIVSANQAPLVKESSVNPWLSQTGLQQIPVNTAWQTPNQQAPLLQHHVPNGHPLSAPWQNGGFSNQAHPWTLGNGLNNWKKLHDVESPFSYMKSSAMRALTDSKYQKSLFKKLDFRMLRSNFNYI